jgi:transcriptional regulator
MYLPEHFKEDRPEILRELIDKHPLGALVTLGAEGLEANHIPCLYDGKTLRGHLSRANGQWQHYKPEVEALAIFQGPEIYISPNWYPTKQEHGRAVPTWNYVTVHAYGILTVYSDPDRLRAFLDELTAAHEANLPMPWRIADAPRQYIEGLLKAIVGIELSITRIEGKWKMSQNQPAENRESVAVEIARLIRGEKG